MLGAGWMSDKMMRARRVLDVRRVAGLTQWQLAKRLGRSQTVVSQAEWGATRIGHRYVRAVMVACGLLPEGAEDEGAAEQTQGYVVGLDPENGEVVRRGTQRDEQLSQQYAWWSNGHWRG
jgi:DNA-binding XRE family transcriptional regulator